LAAAVPIGAAAPPPAGGAGCDGAPKPPDPGCAGAGVVVEASPGQDVDPVPGAHCADGADVVVVADFFPAFGFGHFAVGGVAGVEPAEPVGAVVVVEEPERPLDLLPVVAVVPDGAAAVCSSVWGTAEFPATAGVNPATAAAANVTAATPSRPMLMRNIGTSLFRSGRTGRRTGDPEHRRRWARHRARFCRSAQEKGLPAQLGTNYLKRV
jgi:hypothetical protein